MENVLCFCIVRKNVKIAWNYVPFVVVERITGQCEMNEIVAVCVVGLKKSS